jgi:hypothetical protein
MLLRICLAAVSVAAVTVGNPRAWATETREDLRGAPAPWAICGPGGGGCRDLEPPQIHMNVCPKLKLQIPLPHGFKVVSHMWTLEHDDMNLSLRQSIVGASLRKKLDRHWLELGLGFAQGSRAESVNERADASDSVGRMGLALLAGTGTGIAAGDHMHFDLRLRGGMGVGRYGEGVFHAHLVVAFSWR